MSQSDKNKNAPNNSRNVLIIVAIVFLIIINGVQFYVNKKSEERIREQLDNKELELVATFAKLDSISNQLDLKIAEIEQLGGNVDSLLTIKEQLEKEKYELRVSKNLAQSRYNKIKDKLEGYEMLLKRKDEEIAKLKEVNESLLSETIELKNQKNDLQDQISSLKVERGELEEKITAASTLRAINTNFYAISKRGKRKDGREFKVRHLEKLGITFNIDENNLSEIGTKKILLRIIEPEGSALYNIASESGSFMYKGSELFYTAMKELLFDNSRQKVSFEYDKGSEFKKGVYKTELYCEGALIGNSSFIVK